MSSAVSVIRDIVRGELAELRFAELAVVEAGGLHPHAAAGDGDNYSCDVRLRNGGLLLGKVPVATDRVGTVAVPNEGDLVLLTFAHGDVNQPVLIGRLYADDDRPPVNRSGEFVFRLPLAEPDERTVRFEIRNLGDAAPPREFTVRMAPKTELVLHDAEAVLRVGDTRIRLSQEGSRDGEVRIEAGRSTVTISQDGDVTVDSAGALTLKAAGDVSISGTNVDISSRAATTVSAGTQLSASGKVGATVDGGMSATLKGLSVSVSGVTSFGP